MFHVGEELAVEVLPTRLLSIEGPELEVGDLLATSGCSEEKPAVDGGVNDVLDGLLGGAAGAVRRWRAGEGDRRAGEGGSVHGLGEGEIGCHAARG